MLVECNDLSNLTNNVTAIYVHSSDIAWGMIDKNVVGIILTDNKKEWSAIVKTGKQVYIHPVNADLEMAAHLAEYLVDHGLQCYIMLNDEWMKWTKIASRRLVIRAARSHYSSHLL